MSERRRMEYFVRHEPSPAVVARFSQSGVHIWSGEHGCWWRADSQGYTTLRREAGVYSLADAIDNTRHCGREKRISFERVPVADRPLPPASGEGGEL